MIQRLRKHKSAIIAELKREERRVKVLATLVENPDNQLAFITDMNCDAENVIVTIALRDQYTFEIAIPKNRYDAFMVLKILNIKTVH